MKYASILIVLVLAGCADSRTRTNEERISALEHSLDYVYEVIRPRRVSPEHCESLSDEFKTCSLRGEPLNCLCDYKQDEWDTTNKEFNAAVGAKARELLAKQAEAAAKEEQGEDDDE